LPSKQARGADADLAAAVVVVVVMEGVVELIGDL
jgi:hypothetical protein